MKINELYKIFYDNKSLIKTLNYIKDNKEIFQSALKGETIEHFKRKRKIKAQSGEETEEETGEETGVSITIIVIVILAIIIWMWAIYALILYWKILPDWAKIISLICILVPYTGGGPVIALLIIYISKGHSNNTLTSSFGNYKSSRCY